MLHKPAGLKAKRLLLISGGAAKKFTTYDLRRVAGAAVRTLKSRGIRSFAFIAPPSVPAEEAVTVLREVEEPLFRAVLDYAAGNQSRAAVILGINRGTLRKKLRELGLSE